MDMYVTRENLLHSFTCQRANIGQYGCPVVLVGHCLGGLVMKELCVQASSILGEKRANEQDERVENLLRNVKGLFFFATPHQGSKLADFNNASLKGALLDVFKTLNKDTARRNEEFRQVRERYKWKTFGVGESCETTLGRYFKGMVVPEVSSRNYMDDYFTIPDADHLTVCQPGSKQSSGFEKLFGFVGRILKQDQNRLSTKIKLSVEDVGLDVQVKKILETLRDERRLGMVGIGGIGKSTLARAVFDTISGRFDYTCFLHGVKTSIGAGEDSKLQDLILGKLHHNGHLVNTEFCWSTLKGKKVLIVLDDADNESQVMVMTESDGFSKESRVIVTARERQFLKQQDFFTILVEPLNPDDSKRLFCLHAFKGEVAAKGYEERVTKFTMKCGGLPLALKIVGGYLYGQGKDKNEREKADVWDGAFIKLKQAKSMDGKKQDGLWSILKICYENLANQEQEMFLDVATCFHGEIWENVLEAWRVCSWSRASQVTGWNNLVDMGLVRVDQYGCIWMHEVLRDLGRSIACPDDKNVASHTRVFDVRLTKQLSNQEKALVKVIKITHDYLEDVHIGFLGGLKELEILWLDGCSLDWPESMGDVFPPQLVFLRMGCFPEDLVALQHQLGCLPSCRYIFLDLYDFDDDRLEHLLGSLGQLYQLEHLQLQGCMSLTSARPQKFRHFIQDWDHRGCTSLKTLPAKFGELSQLRHLELHGCCSLKMLPIEFGELSQLQHLELTDFEKLTTLPARFGELSQLQHLDLRGCENLTTFPAEFGKLKGLRHLDVKFCGLQELPGSFVQLEALEELKIEHCPYLCIRLSCLWDLLHLKRLEIKSCEKIDGWTELVDLKELVDPSLSEYNWVDEVLNSPSSNDIIISPSSSGTIRRLCDFTMADLHLAKFLNCKESGVIVRTLYSDQEQNDDFIFHAHHSSYSDQEHGAFDSYCHIGNLATLPERWGQVQALQMLTIENGGLPELEVLWQFQELKVLVFESIPPHLDDLEDFKLGLFNQLTTLLATLGHLRSLETLVVRGCHILTELPQALGQLGALQKLQIQRCYGLKALPNTLGELGALQELHIVECPGLKALPNTLGQLGALQKLHIAECPGLEALPDTLGQLGALQKLSIKSCPGLIALPDTLDQLGALGKLHIEECPGLETPSHTLGQLGALQNLDVLLWKQYMALPDKYALRRL